MSLHFVSSDVSSGTSKPFGVKFGYSLSLLQVHQKSALYIRNVGGLMTMALSIKEIRPHIKDLFIYHPLGLHLTRAGV